MSVFVMLMVLNAASVGLISLPNDGPTPAPVAWSELGETQMERNEF